MSSSAGRVCMVDLDGAREKGVISEKQFLELNGGAGASPARTGLTANVLETDKLFCSDAVQKGFEPKQLTPTEVEVLEKVCPGWMRMKKGEIITRIMEVCGVSRSWLYRDHRLDLRKEKGDALDKLTEEQRDKVFKIKLTSKTNMRFIHECRKEEILPRFSERTWYRISSKLDTELQDELLLVNAGALTLRQQTEPILRDRTYLRALQVIVGDYWRVDRIVKWIDGSLVRPALAVWIDWRTNMIVGAALTQYPSAIGTKTSLYNCFSNYGIPRIAFMDNGKEFKAHRVAGDKLEEVNIRIEFVDEIERDLKNFEYKGILPAMGIHSMRAIVKNPRSKPVERTFGRGGFTDWAKQFHDWVGTKYWEMPETISKAITKYRQGKAYIEPLSGQVIPFCDLYDLAASIQAFIFFHNTRTSEGFGMDGMSPLALYDELTREYPVRRANVSELAFHFMEGDTRKIRNTGHIEFKKEFFYRNDALWRHRGESVYIRFNPVDGFWWNRADNKQFQFLPKSLLVFDIEGKFICEATFVERQHPLEADVKTLMAKQRATAVEATGNVRMLLTTPSPLIPLPEGEGNILASTKPSAPPVDIVETVKAIEEARVDEEEKERERITKKFGLISEL